MLPSAAELVARYLKASGYDETLASFIKEAGLPKDAGSTSSNTMTIEQILQEKKTFDLSINFTKMRLEDQNHGWYLPDPRTPRICPLPTRSNILSINVFDLLLPAATESKSCILVTTADRRVHVIDAASPSLEVLHSYTEFHDAPILDVLVLYGKYLLVASMSGRLALYNTATNQIINDRKDHAKYIVKLAMHSDGNTTIIATAGWDSKVHFYRLQNSDSQNVMLGEPFAIITLPSMPETIMFIQSADFVSPLLLLTRRDSTFLYYYAIPAEATLEEMVPLGKQNLSPHSNAWVAFTPVDVKICPSDSSLVAVATSSTPHQKLLLVRLLIPPRQEDRTSSGLIERRETVDLELTEPTTQASQARAELVVQNREEGAIIINISTLAPQTMYSTPKLAWRPDGSGIFTNSDDGVIRAFEASTGKLIATLEAHEPGSKIRCLWAGRLGVPHRENRSDTIDGKETLISGGFDQRLVIWQVQ
ncbi:WD40 repeat-like protein [Amniculicola lignicola CBS 123094]|uniref:WD40 repeat-like protein n=1 Tax=Amniculicola lignicola CBS 123094 TaxID=1392246 RepID=A0A6A5WHG6_9PLEO|nr:WD40 repeat-like protein [Amniculicola lignicola CBS 123094]